MSSEWDEAIEEIRQARERSVGHGGPKRVEREHSKGRLMARERIDLLLDPGSFQEIGMLASLTTRSPEGAPLEKLPASFICGFGTIDGRRVAVGAEDFTVAMGTWSGQYLFKPKGSWGNDGYIEMLAHRFQVPLFLLLHGVGGDVGPTKEEGIPPGMSVYPIVDLLDRVPVATGVMGVCGGASAVRAVCSHFSVMSRENGALFAGGPPLVERSLGQKVDRFELGGEDVHLREAGSVDNGAESEEDIIAQLKRFHSFMPDNVHHLPKRLEPSDDDPPGRLCEKLLKIVPKQPRRVYNPRALIKEVCDKESFFEFGSDWAKPLIVGLARIGGIPIGVLASDNRHSGGALTPEAADKQARFVDLCNTFHIPIVYFADIPGFMVGPASERAGMLRRGARALQAIHRSSVPVITVQIRRAFGIGSQATGNPDFLQIKIAWPSMVTGPGGMPVEGGAFAMYRREIEQAENPHEFMRQVEERLLAEVPSALESAETFDVEDLIDPRETRKVVYRWLDLAFSSQRPGAKTGPQYRV